MQKPYHTYPSWLLYLKYPITTNHRNNAKLLDLNLYRKHPFNFYNTFFAWQPRYLNSHIYLILKCIFQECETAFENKYTKTIYHQNFFLRKEMAQEKEECGSRKVNIKFKERNMSLGCCLCQLENKIFATMEYLRWEEIAADGWKKCKRGKGALKKGKR